MDAAWFLIGERVALRPLEVADAAQLARWMNDPLVRKHLHTVRPQSVAEAEAQLAGPPKPGELRLGVALRQPGKLIGYLALRELDAASRHARLSVRFGEPEEWGKGYATEATRLFLRHAFETLNLHRVWLHVTVNNPAARRVYDKLGFQQEGLLRHHRFKEGKWCDTIVMGLLEGELR